MPACDRVLYLSKNLLTERSAKASATKHQKDDLQMNANHDNAVPSQVTKCRRLFSSVGRQHLIQAMQYRSQRARCSSSSWKLGRSQVQGKSLNIRIVRYVA